MDASWTAYFDGVTLESGPGGVTYISAVVKDQSALHGLLSRVRDLNLKLLSVQLMDSAGIRPDVD
jgi:hypothetical protein